MTALLKYYDYLIERSLTENCVNGHIFKQTLIRTRTLKEICKTFKNGTFQFFGNSEDMNEEAGKRNAIMRFSQNV